MSSMAMPKPQRFRSRSDDAAGRALLHRDALGDLEHDVPGRRGPASPTCRTNVSAGELGVESAWADVLRKSFNPGAQVAPGRAQRAAAAEPLELEEPARALGEGEEALGVLEGPSRRARG